MNKVILYISFVQNEEKIKRYQVRTLEQKACIFTRVKHVSTYSVHSSWHERQREGQTHNRQAEGEKNRMREQTYFQIGCSLKLFYE